MEAYVARVVTLSTTLLAAAAVVLTACSSGEPRAGGPTGSGPAESGGASASPSPSTPAPPVGPPDPCDLVSDEDAAAAGVTIHSRALTAEPFSPSVPTERFCLLLDSIDRYISVHVSEGGQEDYDFFRDQHAIEYSFQDLTGLGDAAHAITTEVVVLVGTYVIRFNLQLYDQGVDPATQQQRVIDLARACTDTIP